MKITFVVPALNLTGGIRVVAIYSSYLANKGHVVTVVSPNKRIFSLKTRLKSFLKGNGWDAGSHFATDFFSNPKVNLKVVDTWRDITEDDVPDGDIVIATFWNTAEWVKSYSIAKGVKFYLIQHYEIHPWLPIDRVKNTLKLPFKKIVVAGWLKNILVHDYGADNVTVIANGVDHKQFYSDGKRSKQTIPTVGFFYSERAFKGCDVIIKAINSVREIYPEVRVIAMGMKQATKELLLPENTNYVQDPAQDQIKNIYSQCDVWLFGSRSEGFGLTLLEAMACRTPVIATNAGAAPELMAESGGQLIAIDDIKAMADAIIRIINMGQADWQFYSEKAYNASCMHSWEKSADKLEKLLLHESQKA
tara:strand:+ start:4678 stop:5763 length:1086 start_codon:yes stop_codon:yes gene_type:complete